MLARSPSLRRLLLALVAAGLALGLAGPAAAQDGADAGSGEEHAVEILQIGGRIDPPVLATIRDLVAEANERSSELVVLEVDSRAGVSIDPLELAEPLLASDVPVTVWVGPGEARAAGAAVFLLAASHAPAASSAARIGPACPATVRGPCDEAAGAGLVELLVQQRGLADADATEDALWPAQGAITADQAEDVGLVDLVVDGLEPLLVELDGREVTTASGPRELRLRQDEVTVRFHSLGLLRRVLHATLDPTLIYLLLVATLGLLLFETFQPGIGVAAVAALLTAPLAVYGLAVLPIRWWGLALVIAGMLLLALDLAIAGLGVPTLIGAAGFAVGSWFLFDGEGDVLGLSPWLIGAMTVAAVAFFVVVMTVVLRAQAGPDLDEVAEDLVGKVGVVRSSLNPEGHVFVAGALWRARWAGGEPGRIRAGTRVRIDAIEDAVLVVSGVGSDDRAEVEGSTTGSNAG